MSTEHAMISLAHRTAWWQHGSSGAPAVRHVAVVLAAVVGVSFGISQMVVSIALCFMIRCSATHSLAQSTVRSGNTDSGQHARRYVGLEHNRSEGILFGNRRSLIAVTQPRAPTVPVAVDAVEA